MVKATGADASATNHTMANVASWVLIVAFLGLLLSAVVPAMSHGSGGDAATALFFMLGLTATLVGTGLALAASVSRPRTALGGLLLIVGLILLFGIVPSIAALGVVLLGVAVEIGSLPGE
jgi:hypothetical protein